MTGIELRSTRAIVAIVFVLLSRTPALAQKTDVVTLANGDRITGEITILERGRLEFSTDDAGTLYLEWDKLVSLVTKRQVEVLTGSGRRYLGALAAADVRSLAVVTFAGTTTLRMAEVTLIEPIGTSFWRKLDGSFDVGFNYTQSSGIAQLNVNSSTTYRRLASSIRLTASLTQTQTEGEDGTDDRGTVEGSYLRYRWPRWFIAAAARFESNASLGLELRSQFGAVIGPRVVNSNRGQLTLGTGLAVNDERGVDVEATQNVEAVFGLEGSFYTYDRPKTNLDVRLQYYPSLSNTGRQRIQLDAGVKRELLKDFFVSLNLYNSYDNRPPNPAASNNDVGVVLSIGWTY
jgi:hypothetical protein